MHSTQLYMSIHGRINRETYWKRWVVPFLVIGSIINVIAYALGWLDGEIWLVDSYVEDILMLLSFVGFEISDPDMVAQIKFWSLLSSLSSGTWGVVLIKRLHDRGHSAWFLLVGLIPLIGPLWITIECGLLPGVDEENDYGLPMYDMV